jgi:arylformamidase
MLVDVSHVVEHGMVTYKGLPAPLGCDVLSREQSRSHYTPGTEFHIGKVEMVANTGTYLDSPSHRYADGKGLSELPLDRLASLQGVVISADLTKGRPSAVRPSRATTSGARRSWSAPAGMRTGAPTSISRATPS